MTKLWLIVPRRRKRRPQLRSPTKTPDPKRREGLRKTKKLRICLWHRGLRVCGCSSALTSVLQKVSVLSILSSQFDNNSILIEQVSLTLYLIAKISGKFECLTITSDFEIYSNLATRGNAFALFLKSQRKWNNPALQDDQRDQFRKLCAEKGYDASK